MSGTIILPRTNSITFEPRELQLENQLTRKWHVPIRATLKTREKIHSGELVIDLTDRMIKIPVSLITYNSKKAVVISSNEDEGAFQRFEVNNGYLIFKASPQYSAALFHLGLAEDPTFNYLKSFYPEVRPYLYFDQFFGGIVPQLSPAGVYHDRQFREIEFTVEVISNGSWRGVAFHSPLLTHDERIKGLQCTVRYWTVPDAPLILADFEVINKSGVKREMAVSLTAYLNCTGKGNHVFHGEEGEGVGILRASDHGSYIGFRNQSRVAFHQRPDSRKSLGVALLSERFLQLEEGVGVITRNLELAEFWIRRDFVTLQAQDT